MPFQSKGNTVRSPYFIGVLFLAASLVVGCGIGKPKQILDDRPAPAQVGSAVPAVPVQNPVELSAFSVDPCGVLKPAEVAALIADPPDEVKSETYNIGYHRACMWDKYRAGSLVVGIPDASSGDLVDRITQQRESPEKFSQWRELSIGGLPAIEHVGNPPIFEYKGSTVKACIVEVGVYDTKRLEFT
jgi:hypothetical protein